MSNPFVMPLVNRLEWAIMKLEEAQNYMPPALADIWNAAAVTREIADCKQLIDYMKATGSTRPLAPGAAAQPLQLVVGGKQHA